MTNTNIRMMRDAREVRSKVWPLAVTMLTGAAIVGIAIAYFFIQSGF